MVKRFSKFNKVVFMGLIASMVLVGCTGNKTEQVLDEKPIEQANNDTAGLVHEKTLELKYAKHFSVDYYKDGYKIITDASNRKTLFVPEGKEVPEIEEDVHVLTQSIETVGLYSTFDAAWFRPLNELKRIKTVTFEEEKWRIDEIAEGMKDGEITYIGKSSALDYELLQSANPTVHLLSKSSEDELFPKFDELGLDYISMGAYLEEDPRGRLEWVKFVGALVDKDEEAEEFFNLELARIEEITKKVAEANKEKPKVALVYFSGSKEVFYVNNGKGHQAITTELSGGTTYPDGLDQEKSGSVAVTNEEFYKMMEDVDVIIYDNITGHAIQNIDDMLQKADYLADIKAVKEGKVWGLQKDYWQAADRIGDIIVDLNEVIYEESGELEENTYYYLMK